MAPIDGPSSEPLSTDGTFPISPARLGELMEQMYRYGWELARSLPGRESPVPIRFVVTVDRENASVSVRADI